MQELINQQGTLENWHIQSNFEAKMVGRAAVWQHVDGAEVLYLHHPGSEDMATTENEFLEREHSSAHQPILVPRAIADVAESTFRRIADSGVAWNKIEPDVAKVFVAVIDRGRNTRKRSPLQREYNSIAEPDALVNAVRGAMSQLPALQGRGRAA